MEWSQHTINIFVFLLLPPWRCPHDWPKHVAGHYVIRLHFIPSKVHLLVLLTFSSLMVRWYTNKFNIQQLYALPTLYFMCFVFIWEQTVTCGTYNINWLVFMTEMKSVYCAVRTGSLNKAVYALFLKVFKGPGFWPVEAETCRIEGINIVLIYTGSSESRCALRLQCIVIAHTCLMN